MFCLHPEAKTAKRRNLERALLRQRPGIQGRRDRLVKKKAAIAANMVARGGFEPPQAASKAAVLTITQPGNQKTVCIIAYVPSNILMFLTDLFHQG